MCTIPKLWRWTPSASVPASLLSTYPLFSRPILRSAASSCGAQKLLVLSRRGIEEASPATNNVVRTPAERGVDISDKTQIANIIRGLSGSFSTTPIKGILHAAVSYLDLSFDKLTVSRWRDSLAAKVQGMRNLHEETLSLNSPLDFFVMMTSLESIYALATQSAYTAANAFQDAFARYRRRIGLPATSVSLGFVMGIGELGQESITVDIFERNRALTLSEDKGKSPVWRVGQRFDAAITTSDPEDPSKIVDFVTDAVSTAVAGLLFVEVSNVDPTRSVAAHGVDSLIAAEEGQSGR
ncbi:KR domain-containing protein [Astrocystis sublimbata]|nr:KR domain-containing protein [Astrocystis sublimbata]